MRRAVHLVRAAEQLLGPRRDRPAQARQLARLRALVAHTWKQHPAYARWWLEHGLPHGTLPRTLEDLARFPVITKQHFQALPPGESVSLDYRNEYRIRDLTSGSTGVPMAIERTPAEDLEMCAYRLTENFRYGLRWGGLRVIVNAGLAQTEGLAVIEAKSPWTRAGLLPRRYVNYVQLGPDGVLRRLRELRPCMLGGHAEALWRLALDYPSGELRDPGIRFLTPGAQTVTPDMSARMRAAYGAPVYNCYGASEFNLLASECPVTGLLHLNEEGLIVEVLRDGRPAREDEQGEVVTTNLATRAMPFIRYALNDVAVMGPARCPCGRPVRTLRNVQGRVAEFFHFPGGRKVHASELINPLLRFVGWMKEYRMVQAARDRVEVWFDVLGEAPADACAQVREVVAARTGPTVQVEAIRRPIPPLPERGKNKMFQALPPER